MLKFLAHDTVNDVALIKTAFCYTVRYGLQNESFPLNNPEAALEGFNACVLHAVNCAGEFEQC